MAEQSLQEFLDADPEVMAEFEQYAPMPQSDAQQQTVANAVTPEVSQAFQEAAPVQNAPMQGVTPVATSPQPTQDIIGQVSDQVASEKQIADSIIAQEDYLNFKTELENAVRIDAMGGVKPEALREKYAFHFENLKRLQDRAMQSGFNPNAQRQPAQGDMLPEGMTLAGQAQPPAIGPMTKEQFQASQPQPDPYQQAMSDLMGSFGLMEQGIALARSSGMAQAAEEAAIAEQASIENQNYIQSQKIKQQNADDALRKETDDLNRMANELSGMRVNPNKYFADASTGEKIVSSIALLLGAFGAAKGGVNQAVEQINRNIDRDIDAQKSNITLRGKQFRIKSGIYDRMRQRFQDDIAATEASRMAYLQGVEIDLKQTAMKYKGQEIAANAMKALGEVQAKKLDALGKFAERMKTIRPVDINTDPQTLDADTAKRFVRGYGVAPDAESARNFRNEIAANQFGLKMINELKDIAKQGGKSLSPTLRRRAQSIAGLLKGRLRIGVVGGGQVTDREWKILDGIVANPTTIFSLDFANLAALDQLADSIKQSEYARADSFGLKTPLSRFETRPVTAER